MDGKEGGLKYFVSAIDDTSNGIIAREIEAVSFADAKDVLERVMMENFGAERGRITSITEVPERGPIALAVHLDRRTVA